MRSEGNPLCTNSHSLAEDLLRTHKPKVCFDIGAHKGGYFPFILDCCPETTIYAFEPVPMWYKEMEEKFGSDPRVVMNRMAISDRCFTMRDMQLYNGWTIASPEMKVPLEFCPGENEKFDVASITLDDYCSRAKLQPGFMKVDVDGYEQKFLTGSRKLLKEVHPFMMIELSYLMLRLGDSIEAWVKELLDLGYTFSSMDGKVAFTRLEDVLDCYPYNTSFDVMLI